MKGTAANLLSEARKAAGLSQADLAERVGIHRSAVTMYETGAREPGAEIFLRLLTATGAAVESMRPSMRIDCWRNSAVFTSLTSVLESVPIKPAGPLRYPADVWRRAS